ncbi:crtp2 [Symbiodinium microadriaticum]|nr:crtp2 [Symbiodinium microadriaticum]
MQVCLFLVTTTVVALNSLYFKRMLNCYRSIGGFEQHDYSVFVSVFDILLWALFMSAVAHATGARPLQLAAFPRRALLRVAAVDQLGTLLASVGATHLAGQVQVLMNQSVLPLTILLSLLLGRRFSSGQLLGAGVVLAGAVSAVQLNGEAVSASQLLLRSLFIFSAAQVAVASATLLKEALLQRPATSQRTNEFDEAISLGVAIAWRRVPMGIALALLVPLRVQSHSRGLWADLRDGFLCFCGQQPRFGDLGCPAAAGTTFMSVGFYSLQTFLCLRLTQQAGATIRSIAAVTALPLAQLLFARQGSEGEELGTRSLMGLVLCLSGFAIYTSAEKKKDEAPQRSGLEELEERLRRLELDVQSDLPKLAAEDEGTKILQAADSLALKAEERSILRQPTLKAQPEALPGCSIFVARSLRWCGSYLVYAVDSSLLVYDYRDKEIVAVDTQDPEILATLARDVSGHRILVSADEGVFLTELEQKPQGTEQSASDVSFKVASMQSPTSSKYSAITPLREMKGKGQVTTYLFRGASRQAELSRELERSHVHFGGLAPVERQTSSWPRWMRNMRPSTTVLYQEEKAKAIAAIDEVCDLRTFISARTCRMNKFDFGQMASSDGLCKQFLVWTCGHLQDKHIVLDAASSEVEAVLRRAELGVMLLDHVCDLDFIYRESHLHDASLVSASVIEDEST